MKVLMVTPAYLPQIGGLENTIQALTTNLLAQGLQVEVAHLDHFCKRFESVLIDGVRVHRIPLIGSRLVGWAKGLGRLAKQFDLLHVHDPQLVAVSINAWIQCPRIPMVLSTHGGFRHTGRLAQFKRIHERIFLRRLLNQYQFVLPSSNADADYFKQFTGRIRPCGNGVATDEFLKIQRSSVNPNRWLYWGRLAQHKRLDLVLALVAQLNQSGAGIELTICGPDFDGTHEDLQRQVVSLGLSHQVRILGSLVQDELLEQIARHGIYISASEHEGFGVTLVEAMAAGMLVVCRDKAPMNELGLDRQTSCRLAFDASFADVEKIQQFIGRNSQELLQASQLSRQDSTQFEWKRVVKSYLSVYDRAVIQ